jgi:hypothetical protein
MHFPAITAPLVETSLTTSSTHMAAKAMLYDQDLPRFLWAEACNTVVYIKNRSPHKVLGRKTPEEVFTGRKTEWAKQTLREAQEYVDAPRTSVRESRAPQRFSNYMALMRELLEAKPSNFEEASQQ